MRIASLAGPLEIGGDYTRWVQAARSDQASPQFDSPSRPAPNVGDWFVTKIVDRLIDFDEVLQLTPASSPRDWDEANETCAFVLLKGGNYLFPGWFEQNLRPEVLERFRIPIIMFGAGIQNVPSGGLRFTDDDVRALKIIHDSCASSSVRGHLSAELLASHGIHNVTVTGCPTMFWQRQPRLQLKAPAFDRIGFTLRNYLFDDDPSGLRAQYESLRGVVREGGEVVVVLQGEDRSLQLLNLVERHGAEFAGQARRHGDGSRLISKVRLQADSLLNQAHVALDPVAGSDLVDWLAQHTYSSWDPDGYIDLYKSCGLMVGCRLHSNLVALANGTPAFFLTYDSRTRELVDLIGAPAAEVTDFEPSMLQAAQWDEVQRRYAESLFPTLVSFMESNALPHRLDVRIEQPA